jgi:hypothetical protein
MKKIVFLYLIIIASSFAACSDYVDIVAPSPVIPADNPAVRFAADNPAALEIEPGTTSLTLILLRDEDKAGESLEVALTVRTNTGDLFTVPPSVIFPAGQDTIDLPIGISPDAPAGETLTLEIALDEAYRHPYKAEYGVYTGKISIIRWDLYATGTWTSTLFGQTWPQDLHKIAGQNIYCFFGPYVSGYDFPFRWDGASRNITPLGGEETTYSGTPVHRYATGYVHPSYGMIYFNIDPDPTYTYFNSLTRQLILNGNFTVAAGSFGWLDEVYTLTELKGSLE